METTLAQIYLWRETPSEHQWLEFKEARRQFDNKKLFRYCVAISNEGGGQLILGISNDKPRRVVGTAAFNDPIKMTAILLKNLGFRVDIEEVAHPDGRVLVFHIPSRPRGTAHQFEGAYLMRSGEELAPMSGDRLRQIFSEGEPGWLEQTSKENLSESEVVELLDTQTFFELLELPYPSERAGVIDRLVREQLIDVSGGDVAIRRLGGLLLAKRLEDFSDLARKAPRVVVYEGASKLQTRIDQVGTKGYAVGFKGLIQFIMDQLPQNEVIEGAIRKQMKLVPEITIRELVANALIHQEFTERGMSVMIEVYDNRIEISNPGEPIVALERFIDVYRSRNERLADLMRRFGICEEQGSGIDKVVSAVEVSQLPAPAFPHVENRTSVILFGPRDFADMDHADRVRACFQHCALRWVMRERMTNRTLRERFDLPERKNSTTTVSQVIAATVEAGSIKPDEKATGSRKYARYVPSWA